MRLFPRKNRIFTKLFRVLDALAAAVFIYAVFLPQAQLFAQEYRRFEQSSKKLEGFTDRATRMENEDAWNNYMELGIASERAQWEQEAFDKLQRRLEEIDKSELEQAEKDSEIARARSELEAASETWNQEAEEFKQTKRGEFRADQTDVTVAEVDENLYLELIAQAEAAVAAQAEIDLGGWETAIQATHDAILAGFESELSGELARARAENAGLSGAELTAFETELAEIEAGIRREFEVRDSFYVTRARNRYIALKRGDDLNARLASEASSASNVTDGVIENTLSTLEVETSDMLQAALDETENLVSSPDAASFEAAGTNWEARMEAVISSGLRAWEQAEEDLYARRLAWQQEQKRSREEAEKIWQASHEEIKRARDQWLNDIQLQIKEGREQWQSKIAEFRENREAAEQEMADYIAAERERWDASSKELASIVNGGGGALLETKDAYRYYDDLIKAMPNPGGGSERDRAIYDFYVQQRNYMQGAVQRFQGILAGAEGVLNANMHSGADHTGLLNDVRIFAGDLPERLKALDAAGFEAGLRGEMDSRSEDFVLYRRDMEDLIDRNAVFVERAGDLSTSAEFDYQAAADLDALVELIGKLERKYDDHKLELQDILNKPHEGLDETQRLAAIKADIEAWLAASTDRDARLKTETVAYFNAGLGGYYLTGNEGDPYLMTRAEYEWELLRRERNYLTKKLERAEAVKDYADRAFQHDAGLEMAAVTAERSEIAKTHRDLREIAYQLIRGEIDIDPAVYGGDAAASTRADQELTRILGERDIDRPALDAREATLDAELGMLDTLLGFTTADRDDVTDLVGRIDSYLTAEVGAPEGWGEHPLGIVREKLIKYRDRLDAGASAEERTNSWTALAGGADVLRAEIQALKDDYDFTGLAAQIAAVRDLITRPNLTMIRGDLAQIKEQIAANEKLLADAKEELDLAKDAYRQARIDYDVMRANNSEDLIRIDLTNTTGALGRVIHRMTELENVDGFDAVYDPLTAGRIEYLNEISQREQAQSDLGGSQEALALVRSLEESKKRAAALAGLLGANPNLSAKTAEELADLFLAQKAELVTAGAVDPILNSNPTAIQALNTLEQLKAGQAPARQALDDARSGGDPEQIELARMGVAGLESAVRRSVEQLTAAIRAEERQRRDAFFYYVDSRDGSGDPLIDPIAMAEQSRADDQALTERVYDLSETSAARLSAFLQNNLADGAGNPRAFSELLKQVNDRIDALPSVVRDVQGYGYDDASAQAIAERVEWEVLRAWLVENKAAIQAVAAAPDAADPRGVSERINDLRQQAAALADASALYAEFQASVPDSADHPWVVAHRSDRETLLAELEGVLAASDADLTAAYNALPAERRKLVESYGTPSALYLRESLQAAAAGLRRDLAELNVDFAGAYRRAIYAEQLERIAGIEKDLGPLQSAYQLAALEKGAHQQERDRLAALLAAETDATEQARLTRDIDDLDARIGELQTQIDTLKPQIKTLSAVLQAQAARAQEAAQPGSSSQLAQMVMTSLSVEGQSVTAFEQTVQTLQPQAQQRAAEEVQLSASDTVKVALGFYQTDANGRVLRDGSDLPLVSQEFVDLGIADPAADLGQVLAGDQSGANLMRWAERLSRFAADESRRESVPAEVIAAMDMLEDGIREVLAARAFIDNRYETKGGLQLSAAERRTNAQEGLKKLGLVLQLQDNLEETVQQAVQNGEDPVAAALTLLEQPANAKVLRLYAGYDETGAPDGQVDPLAQARLDELSKLAERLRASRLDAHLIEVRGAYEQLLGDWAAYARGEPLALAPDRADFLATRNELKREPVATAIDALAGDEGFRAALWQWSENAPAEARLYRGRVIEILTASSAEGQALKDEVVQALSDFETRIADGLDAAFAESERKAARDANLEVRTSVTELMAAYARRGTLTRDTVLPALEAIPDLADFTQARTTVRAKMDELAALENGEAGPATLELRRRMLEIIGEAGDTVQLKSNLRVYLNSLSDPAAGEIEKLESELAERSLLESAAYMNAAPAYVAEDYPAELRDFLLARSYQNGVKRYEEYTAARASSLAAERENAALDLSGMNGDIANYLLLNDFSEYRTANDPVAALAAADPARGLSIDEYLAGYLEDRNSAPELLPQGGAALVEQVAHAEYRRLEADIAAVGIAAIDESKYFAEFREIILLKKAQDFAARNGLALSGATAAERAENLRGQLDAFLNDATYDLGGKTLAQRVLLRGERDALFANWFSSMEYAPGIEAYLPAALDGVRVADRLDEEPLAAADFLPEELNDIAGYATVDVRNLLSGAGDAALKAYAQNEVLRTVAAEPNFAALRLSDAELGALVDRSGAPAALRTELVAFLRTQNTAALSGGAQSAAEAVSVLRRQKVLETLVPDRAEREALALFLNAEGTRLQRIEAKFMNALAARHADLQQATKEERGNILRAVIERAAGQSSAYYNALSPALKAELDLLQAELFGAGEAALSADEQAVLNSETTNYSRAFDLRAESDLVASGVFEALEAAALAALDRSANDALPQAGRADRPALLRALVDAFYVGQGDRPALSPATRAFFDAAPGLESLLVRAASELPEALADILMRESVLVDRFLTQYQETAAERAELEAIFSDPGVLNPRAPLGLGYETQRDAALVGVEQQELAGALVATVQNQGEYFESRQVEYEREIAVTTELQKFAATLRTGGEYVESRYASMRTYVGTERKYQDQDLTEEEKAAGVLLSASLGQNDPEALLNSADWDEVLQSDSAAYAKEVTDDQGNPVRLRAVYTVSDTGARYHGSDHEAEMRHTFFEHIANNYLDKISKLNGALSAVFAGAQLAERRVQAGQDDIKQSLRDNYDPNAAANDIAFFESKKVDAQSRLAVHSQDEIRKLQNQVTGLSGSYDSAASEFAQAARRDQIASMPLESYLRDTFNGIAGEMERAEGRHTALAGEAERLRQIMDGKNRELAATLSNMADTWRQYEGANDEYETRARVEEFAETPYLFASQADSEGDEKSTLIDEYRGDAREEYELALRAVDSVNAQLKEAAYAVYVQDDLAEFNAIVTGLEAGETYAALSTEETERLVELRDRKFRDYETLSAAEEQELTALDRREMYTRYQDVIATRAEHIKHSMRMVRLHKANELIRDEVMRRRAVADEKEKQFQQALGTEFGNFDGDEIQTEARNGVYARLAGLVEGGTTNLLNEFRNWYWGGNVWAQDAFNSYLGASQSALRLVEAPKFWPTQIMEGAIGLAGAAMTNIRDRNAIGLWLGGGGSIAEWGMFQGIYFAAIQAMGVRDQMKLKKEITDAIYMPIYQQAMATALYSWGSVATARMAKVKMQVAQLEAQAAQQNMWLLYGLAASTAQTGSIRRVMATQREYEDAKAALYYFTRIPDQRTLKDRMISYGAAQSDDPNDNSGAALYKLTEEDLIYLFDQNENGDPQYLDAAGNEQNPSSEIRNEALDITGIRDQVEYRDAFGRRYDPKTVQDGIPGPLEGGYYWNGNERWTRLRFFNHDGGTYYRYAKVIEEDADLHTVYNMEEVLRAAVPHGQAIRDDRFAKYQQAGNAVAQQLQDQTFVLNERDQTYENLFNQAAGHVEGGREFTGYRMTYDDYRKNADAVFQNELTQRENVQRKEWELREQELIDRYNDWEARVQTILDRGSKSWASSEDRFLQKWREWEREFEKKTKEGETKWDEQVKAHFQKKEDWEAETRASASEATIEKVLGDQIDMLNRQLRASSSVLAEKMPTINRTAMIQDAIAEMRRDMPTGGEKLKAINKNIQAFSAKLGTAELIKGNFQNDANALATTFRAEMKEHQHHMKVLANVKIFEQYRQMIEQFKKTIEVQNRQIANQTAAAAMAQGYVKVGDIFVKRGQTSSAYGVVNAYKWFNVEQAMDAKLTSFGFTPMDGNELVSFLDGKSNVEVEAYFYTQKLAVSAAIEEIQGRGTEQERKGSRDAKVIGEFSAWVGSAKAEDPFQGHAETLLGGSFGGNLEARSMGIDLLQAGFGELGAMGTRPGGAPLGFYVQLKHMGQHVAQADAAGVASANEVDPITNTINAFNPVAALATSYENVEVGSRVYGTNRGKLVGAQFLNVGKQALIAGGQVMMTAGNALIPGGAVAIGAAMIAAGNAIQVNPTTGESSFKMTDQAAIATATSIAGALIPGVGNVVAQAALQAGIGIINAGMEYDENGASKGWKMSGSKLSQKGIGVAVSAVGAGFGAELGGAMGGGMMADAVGSAVGSTLANNLYQHSKGNRQMVADAATVVSSWGSVANAYASSVKAKDDFLEKNPGQKYNYSGISQQFGVGGRFLAGAVGSVAGTFAPVAKLGLAAYEAYSGKEILARQAEQSEQTDDAKKEEDANTANKTNQEQRLKDIQDSYALRQSNRSLWSKLVVHGSGALGMDSDKVGNWMDGNSFASTSALVSLDYGVGAFDDPETRSKAGAAASLLDRAKDQSLSMAEREQALKTFTETAKIHNSNSAATRILTELQLRGARTNDWEGILAKLGGRGKNVSQDEIDKLLKEMGGRLGADMNKEISQNDFQNLYSRHVAAGNAYDAGWRELQAMKYSPAQIRRLLAGESQESVGRPANGPPEPGPNYEKETPTQVTNGERQIIRNDLLGKDGVLGWFDQKLGTNMADSAKELYEGDNVVSAFVRDRDMTRREAAQAYDNLRQDVSDAAAWTQYRLDNMDMADAGWNALRMVGGALQAYAGGVLFAKGAALTGTGIGAIIGVPLMAVGGFMVVNGLADVALGGANIYKNFMGDEDRLRGNIAETYGAITGEEAPEWVDYVDMAAGMVGSFSGLARGGINAVRGAGTFGRAIFSGGLKLSQSIGKGFAKFGDNIGAGLAKFGDNIAALPGKIRQGMANRFVKGFDSGPGQSHQYRGMKDISPIEMSAMSERHADLIRKLEQAGDAGIILSRNADDAAKTGFAARQGFSFNTMSELTMATGREFSLARVNGNLVLNMGKSSTVHLPKNATRWIAHTHPSGNLNLSMMETVGNGRSIRFGDYFTLRNKFPTARSHVLIAPSGPVRRVNISSYFPESIMPKKVLDHSQVRKLMGW